MRIDRIEEFKVSQEIHQIIHDLLSQCFPDYPKDRIYFKQVPDFRYLVWEKKQLIAHMAVEYRVINVAESTMRIFGIVDLCVSAKYQSRKIASYLISELESLAGEQTVDFMVLIAEKHNLYEKKWVQTRR